MRSESTEALVHWAEIKDVELVILRRMREFTLGAHPSLFHGTGLDLAGLRDWQPGDRLSAIDWPQSTLTNFSPLITREFERASSAAVVIVADTSLSTRCGANGVPIAKPIARAIATLSLAAAFLQDKVALITFERGAYYLAVRPQAGKNHAIHCLDAYQDRVLGAAASANSPEKSLGGLLRQQSLVPVVSDFLIEDPEPLLSELAEVNAVHDVFLVMIDSTFAFALPSPSAGWIESYDIETGRTRVLSAREFATLGRRVEEWQDAVDRAAVGRGLQVLRLGADEERFHDAIVEFMVARRLRKR